MKSYKIYAAAPLFTAGERLWNLRLATELRAAGHEVRLPQEEKNCDPSELFKRSLDGILWSDVVLACLDGPDADSGTAVECAYASGICRRVVVYRTDFREGGDAGCGYNLMLRGLATERLDLGRFLQDLPPSEAAEAAATRILKSLETLADGEKHDLSEDGGKNAME